MKTRCILSIVFVLSISSIFAQDWKPVTSGNKYHFLCDTNNVIYTLFADSAKYNGSDSVFYLNRIVLPCDTCQVFPNCQYPYYVQYLYLNNQPQIIQREYKATDSSFWFYSPNSYVIFPYKQINDTWLYDTINNIIATMQQKYEGDVFGNTDSLITILLSTGDSVILSKNHGIVLFPINNNNYFRLYGTEGSIITGRKPAGFKEFFNLNVGDYFVYDYSPVTPGEPLPERWYYEIIQKTEFPDGYQYSVTGHYQNYWFQPLQNYDATITARLSDINSTPFLNYQSPTIYEKYSYSLTDPNYNNQNFKIIKSLENGKTVFRMLSNSLININSICNDTSFHPDIYGSYCEEIIDHSAFDFNCIDDQWIFEYIKTIENIGPVLYLFWHFEVVNTTQLLFCVIQGDTIINQLVNYQTVTKSPEKQFIYPNPAKDKISIANADSFHTANIYTSNGKEILRYNIEGRTESEIDISKLKKGLYFIVLYGYNDYKRAKLLVE